MAHVMKIINSNVIETYCSLHSKINQQGFSIIENVIVTWDIPHDAHRKRHYSWKNDEHSERHL